MKEYLSAVKLLPDWLRDPLLAVGQQAADSACEIRVRAGCGVSVEGSGASLWLESGGERLVPGAEQLQQLVLHLCGYSPYLREQELAQGFISLPGGHRAAVCGRLSPGVRGGVSSVSSVCIRVSRPVPGCAAGIYGCLESGVRSVLVCGEPGCGKTTMLRDIAAFMSGPALGLNLALLDEKGEISPPLSELAGPLRVDSLVGYPKADAAAIALRNLSPDVILCDEIATREDAAAVEYSFRSGIPVVASAHSARGTPPEGAAAAVLQLFQLVIFLDSRRRPGRILCMEAGKG